VLKKILTKNHPLLCILLRWSLDSIRLYEELFSGSKTFVAVERGRGLLKKLKIGKSVEYSKAHRLILLTHPPFKTQAVKKK
jgi:hypothetical protein